MSDRVPTTPTLEEAAQRAWRIGHLVRERAMDRPAALFSLELLHTHPNERIRSLCVRVAETVIAPRPMPEPQVEVFAR